MSLFQYLHPSVRALLQQELERRGVPPSHALVLDAMHAPFSGGADPAQSTFAADGSRSDNDNTVVDNTDTVDPRSYPGLKNLTPEQAANVHQRMTGYDGGNGKPTLEDQIRSLSQSDVQNIKLQPLKIDERYLNDPSFRAPRFDLDENGVDRNTGLAYIPYRDIRPNGTIIINNANDDPSKPDPDRWVRPEAKDMYLNTLHNSRRPIWEVNINSTTGGTHLPDSRHYFDLGIDTNKINGRPVAIWKGKKEIYNPDPELRADVDSFMEAAQQPGGWEVYGPPELRNNKVTSDWDGTTSKWRTITDPDLKAIHQNHVHLSAKGKEQYLLFEGIKKLSRKMPELRLLTDPQIQKK